ncbi:hypothetical protein TWF173_009067 [Orbilia oligospora]|uniref:Serine/threonine-protein phosphatase 4 regulatory subunit 2 n=1 Tax=Arthrobotrys oligospora (strain ATCC 24927 / CBS 115.81 / DSM 1491) TaxID=756982 RepID=G1XDZ4_ARTOA|nr:hypothetical protein AOL_s00080g29 [Orbilia oligospora ATCC 24927]EGX48400.1 hypothetical protein AOL_s00080g29 [Orbilia oligospora ATCC 24927]KAF3310946.1 hypothetical protein TWF173_009067 [Orbilia oligospora]
MKSDEELEVLVNQLTIDSTIGLDDWPDVLQFMLKRLEWIAYNSFPLPKPPPLLGPKPPVSISRESTTIIQSSEEEQTPNSSELAGENRESSSTPTAAPTVDVEATQTQQDPTAQVPASSQPHDPPSVSSTQSTTIPATQFPSDTVNSNNTEKFLPPTLLSSLNSLVTLLNNTFPTAPPHTVQRFAELISKPNKHYRSLAKFLRACHRVVSVTSGADKFPLPISHDGQSSSNAIPIGSGLVNDDDGATGATLTPIPWASAREYVANNGVDAAGSPVSDEGVAALVADEGGNGISQGELLRKEQEADVVITEGTSEDGPMVGGPPELDAADVGPQPEGTVFGEAPKDGDGDKEVDKMDVDEKVEEKGE